MPIHGLITVFLPPARSISFSKGLAKSRGTGLGFNHASEFVRRQSSQPQSQLREQSFAHTAGWRSGISDRQARYPETRAESAGFALSAPRKPAKEFYDVFDSWRV